VGTGGTVVLIAGVLFLSVKPFETSFL